MTKAQRAALAELAGEVIQGDNLQISAFDLADAGIQVSAPIFDVQAMRAASRLCEIYVAEAAGQPYHGMHSHESGLNMNCDPSRHTMEGDKQQICGLLNYLELPDGKTGAVALVLDVRGLGGH